MKISYICPHHSGPIGDRKFSPSQNQPLAAIETAHKERGFNMSELGYYTGYTFVLPPDGPPVQTRKIGEMTCGATGFNFNTVHICMLGNFTLNARGLPVEVPTARQKLDFLNICMKLLRKDLSGFEVNAGTEIDCNLSRILPHRILQPNHTSCYGDYFPDTWARDFVAERVKGDLAVATRLLTLYERLFVLLKQISAFPLGSGGDHYCSGNIKIK